VRSFGKGKAFPATEREGCLDPGPGPDEFVCHNVSMKTEFVRHENGRKPFLVFLFFETKSGLETEPEYTGVQNELI